MDLSDLQARWRGNFNPRAVAPVAGLPAKPGAERIPFHVMCGTLDTRYRDRSGVRREPEGGGPRSQDRMAAEPARPDRTGPCRGTGEVSTASGRVLSRDYESPIALGSSCQWSNPEAGPSLNGCAVRCVERWIQCVVEFPSAAILTSCADAGSAVGRSLGQHSARDGILLP